MGKINLNTQNTLFRNTITLESYILSTFREPTSVRISHFKVLIVMNPVENFASQCFEATLKTLTKKFHIHHSIPYHTTLSPYALHNLFLVLLYNEILELGFNFILNHTLIVPP